jgi:hypothetical protein
MIFECRISPQRRENTLGMIDGERCVPIPQHERKYFPWRNLLDGNEV